MINFRRLALVCGLAILGAASLVTKAGAQAAPVQQPVDFAGTVGSTCTFSGTQAGTLGQFQTNNPWLAGGGGIPQINEGTAGQTTVNCTSGGTLSVGIPVKVAAPTTFVDTVRRAVAYDATSNAFTSAGNAAFGSTSWDKPTTPLTLPANTNRTVRVGMIAGVNNPGTGATPAGTYQYRVTLTATPN